MEEAAKLLSRQDSERSTKSQVSGCDRVQFIYINAESPVINENCRLLLSVETDEFSRRRVVLAACAPESPRSAPIRRYVLAKTPES